MATSYDIILGKNDVGNIHQGGYNAAASAKASEVLQKNMESWHIVFSGPRHNHIVHAVLTILGLGATPEEIQKLYDREASYQKPRFPIDENIVKAMSDKERLKDYLDIYEQYSNFLLFFQREIEAKGVKKTLEEHLFADSEHAHRILPRVFMSIFHPYIHLSYALEYNQPALVAEALAMACVHEPDAKKEAPIWLESEKLAGGPLQPGKKTLREIMEEIHNNEILRASIEGPNPVDRIKNVADNAIEEMIKYGAEYSISESQLQERIDEMIDTCSLLIASKHPTIETDQPYKIDFFLIHSVNTLVMMPKFIDHEWISAENAVRVIEWAGRSHLFNYVSRTAPPLTTAEVNQYPIQRSWDEIYNYSINHPTDDGHLQKCVRSLAYGEKTMSGKFGKNGFLMKPDAWLRLANLVVDAVPYEVEAAEKWLIMFPTADLDAANKYLRA